MSENLTYLDSGVDVRTANHFVQHIKTVAAKTARTGLVSEIGGFAGLFALPLEQFHQPLLVASTDGVGTKLLLAAEFARLDTIGIDLVAMCVNDILVCGATPLFFLDYYSTGHLQLAQAQQIMTGIGEGCQQAHVALLGGETAEMPSLYRDNEFDLAGFVVGIVDKDNVISGNSIQVGDQIIGIAASGIHSNGYSLIRKILQATACDPATRIAGKSLQDHLLEPTKIYVNTIQNLLKSIPIKGLAHITGGGITENLPRVIPQTLAAQIHCAAWPIPEIFTWIQHNGNVSEEEMRLVFNCGIGMIAVVAPEHQQTGLTQLHALGETAWCIGEIVAAHHPEQRVIYCHD